MPLFWLVPAAETLIVAQAILLAASVVPVFLFARDRLPYGPALSLSAAYGLFWGLQQTAIFDVHEMAFAPLAVGLALALPGLVLAPFQMLSAVLVESQVEPAVLTQAFTWLNSGIAAGIALGAAIAGRTVDAYSPRHGFAIALSATVLAAAMAWVVRRTSGQEHRSGQR